MYYLFAGGPAAKAGLEVGDRILSVNGTRLDGGDAAAVHRHAQTLLKGESGTPVTLRFPPQACLVLGRDAVPEETDALAAAEAML